MAGGPGGQAGQAMVGPARALRTLHAWIPPHQRSLHLLGGW